MASDPQEVQPKSDRVETINGVRVRVQRFEVIVSAKHSLWFSWAGDLTATHGPEGEDDNTYKPQFVSVAGASTVSVTVQSGTHVWAHHPTPDRESGPEGLPDVLGLENSLYQHAKYQSEFLNPITTNLNKCVGVFEINNAPPAMGTERDQVEIGAGTNFDPLPAGATKFFIGFHDGRHWTNNTGSIPFDVVVSSRLVKN
jgi:hypothetical protein